MSSSSSLSVAAEREFEKAIRDLAQHARQGWDDSDFIAHADRERARQIDDSHATWMTVSLAVSLLFAGAWFGLDVVTTVALAVIASALCLLAFSKFGQTSGSIVFYPKSAQVIADEARAACHCERLSAIEIDDLTRTALGHYASAAAVDAWLKDGSPLRKRDAMALNRFVLAHEKYRARIELATEFSAAAARGRVAYASYFK